MKNLEKLNFEKAASIRDSINILKKLKEQEQYIFQKENINSTYLSFSEFNEFDKLLSHTHG